MALLKRHLNSKFQTDHTCILKDLPPQMKILARLSPKLMLVYLTVVSMLCFSVNIYISTAKL